MGGAVEFPQGTNTPGVTELLREDKTLGVTTAGKGLPREERQGRGGNETPPATRATGAQGDSGSGDKLMGQPSTAADDGGRRKRGYPNEAYRLH